MKILVTGFGGFLSHQENPAEKVAKALQNEDTVVLILPVSYEKSRMLLLRKIEMVRPELILSFGLAASRKEISLEKTAYNAMASSSPDNDGVMKEGEKILPFGEENLSTPFALPALQKCLSEEGIPSVISLDPGRYICNEVYYSDLESGIPSLFVHLPKDENCPLEEAIRAAKILEKALIDSLAKAKE